MNRCTSLSPSIVFRDFFCKETAAVSIRTAMTMVTATAMARGRALPTPCVYCSLHLGSLPICASLPCAPCVLAGEWDNWLCPFCCYKIWK